RVVYAPWPQRASSPLLVPSGWGTHRFGAAPRRTPPATARDTTATHPSSLLARSAGVGPEASQTAAKTPQCLLVLRRLIENCIQEPLKGAVVDERQDTERAIVQFVEGNVARKVSKSPVQIGRVHLVSRFFPPQPPPSSGWWQRARTHGDLATGASWRLDRVSRPPPPVAPPRPRPDGCSGPWAAHSPTYRH